MYSTCGTRGEDVAETTREICERFFQGEGSHFDYIAAVHEVEAAQIALAWLLTRPAVASLVVGGSSVAQFERNFRALDVVLSEAELQRLDEVSRPPLIYPLWHQAQFASPRYGAADGILGS